MKKNGAKHYIEILRANLLSQRRDWERVASSLPARGCLFVVDPDNRKQAQLMRGIARVLRKTGREVVVWGLDQSNQPVKPALTAQFPFHIL